MGESTVTITVDDGMFAVDISFCWQIAGIGCEDPLPNGLPIVADPCTRLDELESSVFMAMEASDPDVDNLTYSASVLPTGLAMNSETGMISGIPTSAGNNSVAVKVHGGKESVSFA